MTKLHELQNILEELRVQIDAQMPEAERLMRQGKDHEFLRVTGLLTKLCAAQGLVADLIVVEFGEPSFGVGGADEPRNV